MTLSDVYQYVPGEMDWLLLNWMQRMKFDGELAHTLSAGVQTPLAFLSFFAQRQLFFCINDLRNVQYACWFEPCMGNAFMGYYVSPESRDQHEEKIYFLFDMLDMAFVAGAQTICGLIQERRTPEITQKFVKLHLRLGYQYAGRVPYFFDGKDCYVVAYTHEAWKNSQDEAWQVRWRRNRTQRRYGRELQQELNGALAVEG